MLEAETRYELSANSGTIEIDLTSCVDSTKQLHQAEIVYLLTILFGGIE